jgi:hypothetical protein
MLAWLSSNDGALRDGAVLKNHHNPAADVVPQLLTVALLNALPAHTRAACDPAAVLPVAGMRYWTPEAALRAP